jgi:hypothetical protein
MSTHPKADVRDGHRLITDDICESQLSSDMDGLRDLVAVQEP